MNEITELQKLHIFIILILITTARVTI